MSETHAKFIKFLSAFLGAIGAAVCIILALTVVSETSAKVLLLVLAAVFLLIVYPMYKVGSLMEELAEQNKKLTLLANRQAKLLKTVDSSSKYSPMNKNAPKSASTDTSAFTPVEAERTLKYTNMETISVPVPPKRQPEPTGELPHEFAATTNRLNAQTGEVELLSKTLEHKRPPRRMTVSEETIELKRGYRAISQLMHTMFHQTTIAAGGLHTVAVAAGGHVYAEGHGKYGQCNVAAWDHILAVAAGTHHTVGLHEDGTCVACGYNGSGQCEVDCWNTIAAIAAGTSHTVGLLANGTCVAVGDNTYGQCNVMDWTDIIAIVANANCTIGLKHDGTVVGVGANTDGGWGAIKWGGIVDVAAGGFHTVGLKADGTCVAVGNNANKQCDVSRWRDVQAVAAGAFHTVGLKKDGTVIAIGHNGHGQCNTSEWREIVAIAAGRNHTIALTRSGRVFAVGDNTYNQCFVQNMNDVKVNRE